MTTISVGSGPDAGPDERIEERIVAVVRELARELSGDRAANAVTATASLERDAGLGSLERVELLTRLEAALGRELDDRFLAYDTATEIARALPDAPVLRGAPTVAVSVAHAETAIRVDDVQTLTEALYRRATAEPDRVHALLETGDGSEPLTYGALWDGAARIGASLAASGVRPGEPVALMLPTGVAYLQSFMGVLAAGAVAVPLYPPVRLDRVGEYLRRQARILVNADVRAMIAMPEAVPVARLLRRAAPALRTVLTVEALRDGERSMSFASGKAGDAALIQYTSGSTGDPKGVVLSHANLLANIRAIAVGVQLTPTDAVVSWLPLYHDMGLIGTWLNTMVNGIPITLLPPLAFLARPERWLWAIHQHRATLSPAPNFAYELCVRKIRDEVLVGLDLSSWRVAANGSEPVSAATLERFTRRFEHYGFRREVLFPVYGLAECSVALCFPPVGRTPLVDTIEREPFISEGRAVPVADGGSAPLRFVSVGTPLAGHEVRLTDEAGIEVPVRRVGRLLLRGPSCMQGYYRNPQATARAMSPGGWIDSGDLAYRDANGELFITGRVKDIIIKGGRNLVPQEIEEVVGAIDGIRKGCVAAFGVHDETSGTESLVVLAESHMTSDEARERLERLAVAALASQVGVPPDIVRVVPPGVVPKTPSGKVRRAAAREAFETGQLGGRPKAPLRVRASVVLSSMLERVRAGSAQVRRAAEVVYLLAAWTLVLALAGPLVAILMYLLPTGRPIRTLGRTLAKLVLAISRCRVEVVGAERLPRSGPIVLVANHTSYADTPILLAALPIDFVFVAMKEILSWRVVGTLARRGEHPLVDRWHRQQSIADAAALQERLKQGERLLFFAEGGFSGARGLRSFRLGAFEAAVASGAPVVPLALSGSRRLLPADTHIPHMGTVRLWVGEPLRTSGTDWRAIVTLRNRAADAIAAHCGEPRLDGLHA